MNIYIFKIIIIIFALILSSCSKIRESAGVTRKSIDEFQAVENPPLIIPPDFNLVEPDQLKGKNIDNIEKELAEEILFGLDEDVSNDQKEVSTMNTILSEANVEDVSNDIRNEIDEQFSQENQNESKTIFNLNQEEDEEVLDPLKESERLKNDNIEKIIEQNKEEKKIKKKKRFIIF
tara:strand:- start:10 stop:540 length:531 start_codon:yes stop_codon:yes gene_type:complete